MRFAGEYLDPTGLYHLARKAVRPGVGRFLQPDPAGQSPNDRAISGYAYAANRPTVMVDPSGEVFGPGVDGIDSAWFITSSVDWRSPDLRCQARACGWTTDPHPSRPHVARGQDIRLGREGSSWAGPTQELTRWATGSPTARSTSGFGSERRSARSSQGKVGPRIGPLDSSNPRFAGLRLTVLGSTDQAYYAHLSRIVVRKFQHVRKDQLLGLLGHSRSAPPAHRAQARRPAPSLSRDEDRWILLGGQR